MKKTVYIKSYGCQMNAYDAERMRDILRPLGFMPVDAPEGADLVILNTCHIREKASDKVYSELGRMREFKMEKRAAGGDMMIAVAGCVAQAEGAEIAARVSAVDLVFGPQSYHRLPELIAMKARQAGVVLDTDFPVEDKFDHLPPRTDVSPVSAFLTIQEGCDKFCSFCVVPYTRGAEYSRPAPAVLEEARALVRLGAREITLLGQNVNAYLGDDGAGGKWSLARLLRELSAMDGLARLRYVTSHPRDMGEDLIAAHGELGKLMPYLHLPVQAGSDRILAAMNRKHTAKDYLDLLARIRRARSDIAISSDFIVGFPGESEADFEATLALVREARFAHSYSFKYSARPGTPGAAMAGQIAEPLKAERLQRLQALLAEQAAEFNEATVGKVIDVLVERTSRREGQLAGRTPHQQTVQIEAGQACLGDVVPVEIVRAGTNSLHGRVFAPTQRAAE